MMLIAHSVNSDWLYNTQSRVLQADWFIMEINEKATLQINISKPYWNMGSYLHNTVFVDRTLQMLDIQNDPQTFEERT